MQRGVVLSLYAGCTSVWVFGQENKNRLRVAAVFGSCPMRSPGCCQSTLSFGQADVPVVAITFANADFQYRTGYC